MPSYRFCRPDDIPLLVHAVETCYRVHDPEEPAWSAESFRRGMREIDLWPSNSMVALDTDGEPVAVMIGTKRADEVAVHRLGVRPDHLRRGHGVHLLTSLSQKLAVLGPERLVAEVPEDRPAAIACFAAAGYRREATLVDWSRPAVTGAAAAEPVPEGLVTELTVGELDGAGLLADSPATAWCRTRRTLTQSAERLAAAAIVSPDRVEAWLVYDETVADAAPEAMPPPGGAVVAGEVVAPPPAGDRPLAVEGGGGPRHGGRAGGGPDRQPSDGRSDGAGPVVVLAGGGADPQRYPFLLGVLLRWLAARHAARPLLAPRLGAGDPSADAGSRRELSGDVLAEHGFAPGRAWALLAARATPL